MDFRVTFWGVRGTFPCAYASHLGFGGNTSCVEVQAGDRTLLLDAGSGLRAAGKHLRRDGIKHATMLVTHTHWDHITGFPFFEPAYCPDFSMDILGGHLQGVACISEALATCMESPLFPVPLETMRADLRFSWIQPGDVLDIDRGITIRTASMNHPGGAIGYRIECAGRSVCYVTDTEHVPGLMDASILRLIEGADMVIYDASYTDEEFEQRRGWGHSTWSEGVKLCQEAGARRLCLFHHDPDHDDATMTAIERAARERMPTAFAAREGTTLDLLRD